MRAIVHDAKGSASTGHVGRGIGAWIREVKLKAYKVLNTRRLRFLLTTTASVYAMMRVRRFCRICYDGNWVQRFPSGTLVEPRLTLRTLRQIEETARDLWMYQYRPVEGDTVVDVGAGSGWETLVFSRLVGMLGRVISIEAHPNVFACLSRMCAENRLENVTPIQAAIMDRECEVLISDREDHLGNRVVGVNSGISVAGTTLDNVLRSSRGSRIDLLKMNIEGAEKYALLGMKETVRKTKYVCISCHDFAVDEGYPPEMRTKAEVVAFLRQSGFSVVVRDSDPRPFVRDYVYGLNLRCLEMKPGVSTCFPESHLTPVSQLPYPPSC